MSIRSARTAVLLTLLAQSMALLPSPRRPSPHPSPTRLQLSLPPSDFDLGVALYDSQLTLSRTVESYLSHPSPLSVVLLFSAGLLTALSPCALSLVPLTIASLNGGLLEKSEQWKSFAMYTLGLASVLSVLGLSAALLGSAVSDKSGLTTELPALMAAALSIVMGLNLLNLVNLQFPSFEFGNRLGGLQLSREFKAFALGASSALVASPCSSPVLTSLLAIVASSGDPSLGFALLFSYSLGYSMPIVFAGNLSALMSKLSTSSDSTNAVLASLLISYGTYSTLDIVSRL